MHAGLGHVDPGLAVIAGVVGAAAGMLGVGYASSVPRHGPLPRSVLAPMAGGGRLLARLTGAAASGLACAVVGGLLRPVALIPVYGLCSVLSVVLAMIDIRAGRLPYPIAGIMYGSCAVAFLVGTAATGDVRPLVRALVAGVGAFLAFLALALAFPGQLGLGDVVLAGWVAFSLGWLAWRAVGVGVLVGLLVQGAVGLAFLLRAGARRALPMGPALLLGWLVGVVAAAW